MFNILIYFNNVYYRFFKNIITNLELNLKEEYQPKFHLNTQSVPRCKHFSSRL
jgi:hypothetical protein